MGFTSAGLAKDGRTEHYQISYDDSLSPFDGLDRAIGLLAKCEQDFTLMSGWFGDIGLIFAFPLPVQIANASGGASWEDPPDSAFVFGTPSPTITLNPGSGRSVDFLRYLLVSEVTEMFMASQKKGWFEETSFFSGADEGSMGEGLSRFLGVQFQLANGLGAIPPSGFGVTPLWLNSNRLDFVNNNPDDHQPNSTTGCTTLFLYYLHNQLGYSINKIIAAGASNLAGVHKNLTGRPDGWTPFITLINSHYPPGSMYNPPGDNLFPVAELSAFYSPNAIICGYSEPTEIFVDRPAMAEVNITLVSDDPSVVMVPPVVTIPAGAMTTSFSVSTSPLPLPFSRKSVNVHATYAGKTLKTVVQVIPPFLANVTLSPDTVVCGEESVGTVSLTAPSLLGDVVVDLLSVAPGFATVPSSVTIPQNQSSATFTISTPEYLIPFRTAHAEIAATYLESNASALLTVKSKVIAGIIDTLTIYPSTVTGGMTCRGTITLIEPVPIDTLVGLAAVEPETGPLPLPGNKSSIVTVPPSVKIPAGQTIASFSIKTSHVPPATRHQARIMAGAVDTKYATVTVTS